MTHYSEDSQRLKISNKSISTSQELLADLSGSTDVCFLRLPIPNERTNNSRLVGIEEILLPMSQLLADSATVIVYGDTVDLVQVHRALTGHLRYQLWITIKCDYTELTSQPTALPHQHVGALVYTKYDRQLQHTKTRLAYPYCPACNKTTKDYGGKKHTYHHYGTLISDVWRDISVQPNGDIQVVLERFADLFGLQHYKELQVFDLSSVFIQRATINAPDYVDQKPIELDRSRLLNADCLTGLASLPDNSIDFAFADPPYNLKKEYRGYADDLSISEYFNWCDEWISQVARVLRPGGTFALLNIPLWSIRHFFHLEKTLNFQNWIVWDALSFPVRMIMPAHYTILCFSKGNPRPLPGLTNKSESILPKTLSSSFQILSPLAEGFCLRSNCIAKRTRLKINDRESLSDVWSDIHRLKHNSRRVDHPCQLPPQLMYRLITLFTHPGEVVLDCFNGAGTTTLAAHQLQRKYIGIELEFQYHQLASARHLEIEQGLDPFRKEDRELQSKNSPVARLKKQKYEIPKKVLQLEVRRIAQLLGRLPTRDEVIAHGKYAIRYYDEYFISWGEVCAAARTTGMTEAKPDQPSNSYSQIRLF